MKLLFVLIFIKANNTKAFFILKRIGLSQHKAKDQVQKVQERYNVPHIFYYSFLRIKFAYLSPYFRKEVC